MVAMIRSVIALHAKRVDLQKMFYRALYSTGTYKVEADVALGAVALEEFTSWSMMEWLSDSYLVREVKIAPIDLLPKDCLDELSTVLPDVQFVKWLKKMRGSTGRDSENLIKEVRIGKNLLIGKNGGNLNGKSLKLTNVVPEGYQCPMYVDKSSWANTDKSSDQFLMKQTGTDGSDLEVTRLGCEDGGKGCSWGMDLKIQCSPSVPPTSARKRSKVVTIGINKTESRGLTLRNVVPEGYQCPTYVDMSSKHPDHQFLIKPIGGSDLEIKRLGCSTEYKKGCSWDFDLKIRCPPINPIAGTCQPWRAAMSCPELAKLRGSAAVVAHLHNNRCADPNQSGQLWCYTDLINCTIGWC